MVHTYSGMENRVLQNLENRVSSLNMEDYIYEIVVPTEEVTEIRNGQRKQVRRTVLPGYVLVRMDLTDESWSTVRHTPRSPDSSDTRTPQFRSASTKWRRCWRPL